MPGGLSPWLWTADTWAGLQFGVLVAAIFVAWRQLAEARRLREEQTRPFVVVDLEPDDFLFMIVVSNLGPSMARDVRITIDPPLTSSVKQHELDKIKMFQEPILSLAPSRRVRTILDSAHERDREKSPDVYDVRVTYTDDTGRRNFTEHQVLDLGLYWDTSEIRRKSVHHVAEQLKTLVAEVSKWTANMPGGLLVVSPTEEQAAVASSSRSGASVRS